jgi:preprotein translocase subunit SecD
MRKERIYAFLVLLIGMAVGFFVYNTERDESNFAFKLGLDLSGGTELIYKADTSQIEEGEEDEAVQALRDVIERRVNLFGVSEPLVQIERASSLAQERDHRLLVQLPGVVDVNEAISLIGQTPLLEFRLARDASEFPDGVPTSTPISELFIDTGLTGRYFKKAQLQFEGGSQLAVQAPVVAIEFNKEGADLFEKITGENTGRVLAIFLDGVPISTPVIQNKIDGGQAVITGNFTAEEGRELARNLNFNSKHRGYPWTRCTGLWHQSRVNGPYGRNTIHAPVVQNSRSCRIFFTRYICANYARTF